MTEREAVSVSESVTETVSARTDRVDFRATSDPALLEAADRSETQLLSYRELYQLWERQHWATQDLDFSQDRIDWHERIDAEERFARMYGLSSFFIGEQRVAAELGPMMRACPDEDMRIFLCTQIADEARHVAFFDRFYSEVGVLEADNLADRLTETSAHLNTQFTVLFDQILHDRVDRLAREPEDLETLVEAVTIYHMVIEGMLALTGPALHHRLQRAAGDAAGLRGGLHQGGPRRAPPRGLRRALPARHGAPGHALRRRDPAHPRRGRAGRGRRAEAALGRGRVGRDLRGLGGGVARLRQSGPVAAPEGDRPGSRRVGRASGDRAVASYTGAPMTPSRLRPEYGPTLAGLVAPRLARLSPAGQRLVRVMAGAFLALVVAAAILWPRAHGFSHSGAASFDLRYARALHRVAPDPGGFLKVEQSRHGLLIQSLEINPLSLPPYEGDPVGELPVYATTYIQSLAARFPGFRLIGEGKTRVNGYPGYTILYTARLGGRSISARDDLFVSDQPGRRDGLAIQMLATPAAHVGGITLIGVNGPGR